MFEHVIECDANVADFYNERKDNFTSLLGETKEKFLKANKEFYNKYQKGIANKDNFYINTIGEFEDIDKRPKREPDYVSRDRDGNVSSEYWYSEDGVIRGSNHWGKEVASCDWFLKSMSDNYSRGLAKYDKQKYGKIKWSDFIQKTDIVTKDGKGVLSTFENTLGKNFDKKLIIKNFNEDETEEYA
jgi:hypothetical protein